jgi:hypothetical protein
MTDPDHPLADPAFVEAVRLTAYFLWEQDGRPEGRHDEYWHRAYEKHLAERRYDRWLNEDVRSDE